ncbi:MAG TPA: nucleotidyltransferase domain-containing protein [Anaerolineae bacterium]
MIAKDEKGRTILGGPLGSIEHRRSALREACAKYDIALAYLYGSQARGSAGPLSDIDVAILFRPEVSRPDRGDRLFHLTGELMSIFRRSDVFVADLDTASPLLRHRVYRDGQLLYCSDDRLRVKFAIEALRDYEDTRPLREIQRHYLTKRIADGTFGRARPALAESKEQYG